MEHDARKVARSWPLVAREVAEPKKNEQAGLCANPIIEKWVYWYTKEWEVGELGTCLR